MEPFEIDIVTRGKLIQINGMIQKNEFQLATFLKSYHERCEGIKKQIIDKFQYKGNELFTSILFWLIIALSELFNLIFYSSKISYELSIIFGLLYTLTFSSLLNFQKQIIVQIVCLGLSVGLLILSYNTTTIIDFYASIGILVTIFTSLFGKIMTSIFDEYYKETPSINLTFQSNLLIVQFLFWKTFQIMLNYYFNVYTFNYDSLILTIAALSSINIIKIYKMFDFQIYHVIKIFKKNYENNIENQNKNSIEMSKSINIYIKQDKIIQQQQAHTEKPLEDDQMNEAKSTFAFQNLFKDAILAQQDKKQSSIQPKEKESYQSNKRLLITIVISVLSLCYLAYIIIKRINSTSALFQGSMFWLGTSVIRTTVLLMICQYQKTIQSQAKDLLAYMLIFICDFVFMVSSAFLMFMPSYINITSEESFILSLSPFLTIKLFTFLNQKVHQTLSNEHYLPLFLFWIIPLSLRQIAYIQDISILAYIIDSIAIAFALFVLVIWSNKEDILLAVKQIKVALISKKNRLKLFQKLKSTQFQYSQILQIFVYIHTLFLNASFYFIPSLTTMYNITYLIIYCAPYLLYLLALIKCNQYKKCLPDYYRPSFTNMFILLASIGYSAVAYMSILSSNHITWSLAILLNIVLFVLTLEGERVIIVFLVNYQNFLRTLIISAIFILIYLPFITCFASGYIMTSFSQTYLFYYAIGGFFYIWLIITIVGVAIHWILNLTEKSKKDLFIAQYMESQMNKINMKEDIEKILMISSMYQLFNYKSEDLLNYLKSQKHMLVIIRKQKEFEYDYELAQPQETEKKKLSIKARPVNMFDLGNLLKPMIENSKQNDKQNNKNNPVLMFFQQKQKNKIQILPFSDENKNQLQLKRMASKFQLIPTNYKQIEKTQQYRNVLSASNQEISDFMSKFYSFLTTPSRLISRQTFSIFLQILTKQELTLQATNKVYDKFSLNSTMDQYKFKHFIIDYVNFKYQMNYDTLSSKLRTFCCRELVPLFLARYESFNYYLLRKKIKITEESIEIWLKDKIQEQIDSQFHLFKQRQLRKKAKLLKKDPKQKKKLIDNNDEGEGQNNDQIEQILKTRKVTIKKQQKKQKQMKDKNFMKPENVYSVIVNSLIECYLFYQKQADNFKIKTIKFSFSNLLAIITKINDIVFVFGYSTVYLFIAYYKQDYSSSSPVFSVISYPILLVLAITLVLIYIILIIYHKKDFQTGKLGLDDNQRSLDFKNFKFYTISILFLLGSGLANNILAIGLNSFICDQATNTLYNFSDTSCYDKFQFGYMLTTLIMILVIYWPLSSIIFPFSTAMNRDLEIKYKSEYQIIYLQVKLLINGFNTLLNPYPYQSQQFIDSIIKVILCTALAILYNQMQPCSYELLNMIEGKIYIILALLSFAGVLCYLVGLLYSTVATGSLLGLYIIYFIYITIKSYAQLKNDNEQNQIHQDNLKNQKLKIEIIKRNNEEELKNQQTMVTSKSKSKQHFQNLTRSKATINLEQTSQIKLASSFINPGEQKSQSKATRKSNQSKKFVFM